MACTMCGSKTGTLADGGCGICGAGRAYNDAAEQIDRAVTEAVEALKAQQTARLIAVGELLSREGCSCECDHDSESHEADCDRCFACRVEAALFGA